MFEKQQETHRDWSRARQERTEDGKQEREPRARRRRACVHSEEFGSSSGGMEGLWMGCGVDTHELSV